MAKVKILVQGYFEKKVANERASSTVVLVQDNDVKIIIDPGLARQPLAESLKKINLKPEDINYVLLTHYHPDHAFGAAWFPQAKILDVSYIYEGDKIIKHDGFVPDTELAIMHTPGHAHEHCCLAVPTDQGMVVVAGDVFWWTDGEKQSMNIKKQDPYATDQPQLEESRSKVKKLADFIIPGHGKIIKVE